MKAQSSIEFLAYVSFSMLILAFLYTVVADKQAEAFNSEVQDTANGIAEKVSFNLEMALVQGDGYSRIISLPRSIAGEEYSLTGANGQVIVNRSSTLYVESSRWEGNEININSSGSNVYRVLHNSSGVYMIEQ